MARIKRSEGQQPKQLIGAKIDVSLFNLVGLYAAYIGQTKAMLLQDLVQKHIAAEEEKGITANKMIRSIALKAMLPWNKNIRYEKFRKDIMINLQIKNLDEETVNYIMAEVDRIHAEKTRGYVK